jgi:phage protein D
MGQCKYCRETIEDGAKKCKTCGEPFYFIGKVLKFVPLLSVLVSVGLLFIALNENKEKQKATQRADVAARRADVAEKAHVEVTRELNAKEEAADQALREIAQKLPASSKDVMLKNLQLPARATLGELEEKAKSAPANADLQRKVFLFRALKEPERE